jgi:hypothetical protein
MMSPAFGTDIEREKYLGVSAEHAQRFSRRAGARLILGHKSMSGPTKSAV